MKLLILLSMITSFSVLGQVSADYESKTQNFRISSFLDFGGRVYYACDVVESVTRSILDEMGATGADVSCTGGISPFGGMATEAYVRTNFEALSLNTTGNTVASYQEVNLTGSNNCHLVNEVIKGLKASFEITSLKTRRCYRTNSRYDVDLTILK